MPRHIAQYEAHLAKLGRCAACEHHDWKAGQTADRLELSSPHGYHHNPNSPQCVQHKGQAKAAGV